MTRAGEFIVQRDDPVAQLCVYCAEAGLHEIKRVERFPVETKDWDERRARSDYKKDMDYFLWLTSRRHSRADAHVILGQKKER